MVDEKIVLPIRVTPEARRQLKIHAAVHSTSVNALLNRAIEAILKDEAIGRQGTTAKPLAA